MKRRCKKDTSKNYKEDEEEVPAKGEDLEEKKISSTKKKASKNIKKKPSKTKSGSMDNLSEKSQSQADSQILEFRHGDDVARDHIRPSFIRRWDGESNELEIFAEELMDLTPMLQVYWRVKCKNMNTIVLIEMGREYMTLENDAIRLHEIFKKKLIKFSKFLMIYFWGKETEIAKKQLFDMKIPVLIMNEFEDPEYREKYGMVRREVAEVLTPALHLSYEDQVPRSRLLLAIYHRDSKFAALVLDSQTNHFFVSEFNDDAYLHEVRRILNKYRPVELLVPQKEHKEITQIAKQICNPYINQVQLREIDFLKTIDKFVLSNPSNLFKELRQMSLKEQGKEIYSKFRVVYALEMVWHYLESLTLLQKVFFQGIFHSMHERMTHSVPFFDSQVYENLEIFRITSSEEQTYAKDGTLMGYLDHCKTQQGRKLLHRWIDQPLTHLEDILTRQEAVSELTDHPILHLHEKFEAYSKLEKRLGDIYHWISRNSERGKLILTRSINYEKQYDLRRNPAVIKLHEIILILKLICEYEALLKEFSKTEIHSMLLRKNVELIAVEDIHRFGIEQINRLQGIPEISYVAQIILRRFAYDQLTSNIEPALGQSQVFDSQKRQIERINQLLDEQLCKWKEYFQTEKVCYVSVRAKNEIQIPKTAISKAAVHRGLIFSSEIANSIRYVTHESSQLSQELIKHEQGMAQSYQPFFQEIVEHFCQYKYLWDRYVQSTAHLDVLVSLAKAARSMPVRCLPTFSESGVDIRKGFHVNLLAIKNDIVPNSIQLTGGEKVLLLTGPNMGGKSTFLKQICTFAILAQMGSYVPAQSYSSIIYDQIFCRMGASDRIYEGKSTFYVELEETKRILAKATHRSMVVIDELGRGTSTFDGMAIAEAILDHLLEKVQCTTLYSTHYTQIAEKFRTNGKVKMMKMGYEPAEGGISFTYQLVEGVAEKSFACNVGRMVGIPEAILQRAERRSQKMHEQIHRKKLARQLHKLADLQSSPLF